MDPMRFDRLAKTLAVGFSRRSLMKGLAGAVAGTLVSGLSAEASCRTFGNHCQSGLECCSGTCEFNARGSGRCGACANQTCTGEHTYFNPRDCQCYCEYDREVCAAGEVCTFPVGCRPAPAPTCPSGTKACGTDCIPVAGCCSTADCADDHLTCTSVNCDPTTRSCSTTIASGACLIDGVCADQGAMRPGTLCQICDPATNQQNWTNSADGSNCGGSGTCAGTCQTGQCSYPDTQTTCQPATCASGTQTEYACNGAGVCVGSTTDCGLYVCSETGVCHTTCQVDTDCVDRAYCDQGGSCRGDGGPGAVCTGDSQCASGHCVDNICCDTACDGACQTCATGTCTAVGNGARCDTGTACVTGETCQDGVCGGGAAVVCTALDQCHEAGTCNPSTGECSSPVCANGTSCNDDNLCTTGDTCQEGVCTGGVPVVCYPLDNCHDAGTCDPSTGQCTNPNKPNGTTCMTPNPCINGPWCTDGVCHGIPDPTCGNQF